GLLEEAVYQLQKGVAVVVGNGRAVVLVQAGPEHVGQIERPGDDRGRVHRLPLVAAEDNRGPVWGQPGSQRLGLLHPFRREGPALRVYPIYWLARAVAYQNQVLIVVWHRAFLSVVVGYHLASLPTHCGAKSGYRILAPDL